MGLRFLFVVSSYTIYLSVYWLLCYIIIVMFVYGLAAE